MTMEMAVIPKKEKPRMEMVKLAADRKGHNFLMDAIIIFN